jgi:hypothetical protein
MHLWPAHSEPTQRKCQLRRRTFLLGVGEWDRRKVWVRFFLFLHWYKLIERETSDGKGLKYWTVADPVHRRGDKPEACRSFHPTTISDAVSLLLPFTLPRWTQCLDEREILIMHLLCGVDTQRGGENTVRLFFPQGREPRCQVVLDSLCDAHVVGRDYLRAVRHQWIRNKSCVPVLRFPSTLCSRCHPVRY